MNKLVEEQYFATGTLMGNRLQEIEFKRSNKTPKMKRGEYQELVSRDGNLVAIKWMDNQHVYLVSSVCGSEPVSLVKRWSKVNKAFVDRMSGRSNIVQQEYGRCGHFEPPY